MEQQQYNRLFTFLWNIANDVLVQAFEKGDYKKITLPFIVLRRLDLLWLTPSSKCSTLARPTPSAPCPRRARRTSSA